MKSMHLPMYGSILICCLPALGQPAPIPPTDQSGAIGSRARPAGPGSINCTSLFDSRCVMGAPPLIPLPVCTAQANPPALDILSGGSGISTLSATCSAGTTQYDWTASSGMTPTGGSSPVTFNAAGNYCFTVRGKNPAAGISYGAPSPSVCVPVNVVSACTPLNDYQETLTCPAGQAGSVIRRWIFNNATCSYSYSDASSCQAAPPICTGGRIWDGAACSCPAGSAWDPQQSSCINNIPNIPNLPVAWQQDASTSEYDALAYSGFRNSTYLCPGGTVQWVGEPFAAWNLRVTSSFAAGGVCFCDASRRNSVYQWTQVANDYSTYERYTCR